MPPSPPWWLWPTIEIPRKLTVSILSVTVIMLSDMVESVMLENEDVLDDKGGNRGRRRLGLRLRPWRETLVWSAICVPMRWLENLVSRNPEKTAATRRCCDSRGSVFLRIDKTSRLQIRADHRRRLVFVSTMPDSAVSVARGGYCQYQDNDHTIRTDKRLTSFTDEAGIAKSKKSNSV